MDQIDNLNLAKTQRPANLIQPNGDKYVALLTFSCLVANKIARGPYACGCPDHNDTTRTFERILNLCVPVFTSRQITVPPDLKTAVFECLRESGDPLNIFTFVGNENVTH